VSESSFTLFPTSGRIYVWRTPKEAYTPECLFPTVKHEGGSVMGWAAILWYLIMLVPLLTFMAIFPPRGRKVKEAVESAFLISLIKQVINKKESA
jgi:hypothetical protein